MNRHVMILGGGVGGMSAAHELIERGFRVSVYERQGIPGGKARSFGVPSSGSGGRRDLPAEHGFRFFPGFYQHLPDTMKRIPFAPGRSVFDNLVGATEMQVLFEGHRSVVVPSRFPRSLTDVQRVLEASGYLTTSVGLTLEDIQFYCGRVWRLLTSCEERRAEELEGDNWWDYIGAANRSPAYQAYLGRTPRVLVAANPTVANTKTVGDILVQLLFNLSAPGVSADRVLNGPTNDVWIGPWLTYLQQRGVEYHFDSPVTGIRCVDGAVAAVRIRIDDVDVERTADYYVAALPVERMAQLVTPDMRDADPDFGGIVTLAGHVDWMNGIQFYFRSERPSIYGHQMHLGSPWALTSLSQAQFWYRDPGGFARHFGDGTVHTVLSVDVSDWNTAGSKGRPARECSPPEVADEVLDQLQQSMPGLKRSDLHPVHACYLDPAIQPGGGGVLTNAEPLLVNRPNSWTLRPWAQTRIPNLFLASDYVRTNTNLATMEAANEAARRAVNAIIDACGARVPRCRVWELHEPVWVKAWRAWDLLQYRRGQAWSPLIPGLVDGMERMVLETAPSVGGPKDYVDFAARETIERGIGVVPSYVQDALVDHVFELGTVLRSGDVDTMRSMFASDAEVVILETPAPVISWLDNLQRYYADGGHIDLDIQRLDGLRVDGTSIVARFAANAAVLGSPPARPGQPARLEVRFARSEPESDSARSPWLISSLRYGG